MKFTTAATTAVLLMASASFIQAFSIVPTRHTHTSSITSITSTNARSTMSNSALYANVMDATKEEETFEFQAEVGRVMDIIINSLYSDKDIFLRELVSNAADACDKKRFLSVTSDAKDADTTPPQIKIRADPENQLVIIEDTGVGMTKDELINNLGKIAQSGTKNFMQALGEGKADVNLIGQFGVGFYSAYLVANKVEVITKSMQAGSPQLRWESDSGSKFTISDASDAEPIEGSGTRLILHMKDDAMQYLESSKLEELLQRYSEFIEFPISIFKEETTYEKVPDEEANKDLKEGEEPKMKTIPVTKSAYNTMNSQKPIWLRPVKEVEDEEYKEFYKSAFRASYDEPQKWSHFRMEGQVECKALLYIPGMLPFELSKDMFDEDARNIRLYVKRVFINDKFDDIMPRWLKFIKGVVDSDDLPLNVSREILQKSKVLSIINKRLVRKSIDMFKDIAADEDPSKYIMFWNNFGKYLKVGVIDDEKNKDELVPLLRFFSSKSGEEYTSFDKYVEGMPEGQKSIYYVTGEGRKNAMLQPVIEKFASRGYEVLLMTEPLDEITIENIRKYKDFDVVDATKEGLDLEEDEESKKEAEELNEKYAEVREYLEVELEGKVQKVKVSKLLTNSPAALVQGAYGVSPTMQRYMKAQSVASGGTGNLGSMNQAVLEINPNHPIVIDLERMIKKDKESPETKNFAMLMYDIASLTGGYEISDTGDFAKRVMSMMTTKAKDDVAKDDDDEEKPSSTEDSKASDDNEDKAVDPEVIV
jgi:heat shock protein beta